MTQGQGTIYTKAQYAAEDDAYGTEGTSYSVIPRVQSCVLNSDNSLIYERGLGEGLNATNTLYGPFSADGSISFFVSDLEFLKHWVGHKTGSGTAGSPYILTEATTISAETATTGVLQPFSVEVFNDDTSDTVEVATGCVGTDFSLSGEIGERLNCTANFVAQKTHFRTTHQTYTPSTDSSYIMVGGNWKWGATPSALSGVRSFTWNYNNQPVVDTRTIESRFINIPRMGQRQYTFTIAIIMAASLATSVINDFYGYSAGGVYSPEDGSNSSSPTSSLQFQINLINGSKYATIDVDECSIDRISKPTSLGGGLVLLNIEGTARKGTSNIPIKWWSV